MKTVQERWELRKLDWSYRQLLQRELEQLNLREYCERCNEPFQLQDRRHVYRYCPACRAEREAERPAREREQARVRMQRLRQRRQAGVTVSAPAHHRNDPEQLRLMVERDLRLRRRP